MSQGWACVVVVSSFRNLWCDTVGTPCLTKDPPPWLQITTLQSSTCPCTHPSRTWLRTLPTLPCDPGSPVHLSLSLFTPSCELTLEGTASRVW